MNTVDEHSGWGPTMAIPRSSLRERSTIPRARQWRTDRLARAQAAVEFAMVAPVLVILLVVGVQLAVIGDAALGLGQIAYQGARYAAVNPTYTQSQVQTYMVGAAGPLIGANNGAYLTTTMTPAPPCAFGGTVTVAVSFDIGHLVVLPNPFLGLIPFPTTLTNSQSAFCEG